VEWQAEGPPATDLARIEINDPELCNRYIGTIIRDVEIGPSPKWMQDRIRRAGMRPISSIVDVTNYVMLEWGQPLHAFDYDKLVARAGGGVPTIIVRRARPGEKMMTLDGVDRVFTEDTLLICDTAGPIAVAGVMGGFETEIDVTTRNILLEAANFDLVSIRRTTQELKLPSEASLRFGKGIHSSLPEPAARRATELMRVLAGGTIAAGIVDAYPVKPEPVVIDLETTEVKRSLGIEFGVNEIATILGSLEFECNVRSERAVQVTVPAHRLDCQYPADLIEELARVYGYDRIPVTELADRLPPQRANRDLELEEQIRDLLVGSGLQEIVTYALTDLGREAALDPALEPDDLSLEQYVVVANPITRDRSIMRHSLLAGALETAAANLRFVDHLAVFEVGKVFLQQPGEELPEEKRRLSVVMTGPRRARHWQEAEGPSLDYYDLKGVVETLLSHLQVRRASYEASEHPTFRRGAIARLTAQRPDGQAASIGFLGELSPVVREAFGLPDQLVLAAELDLEALLSCVPTAWYIEAITPYPAVLQDLALVVDEGLPATEVGDAILRAGGFLLKTVDLFDVYRGDSVAEGKKSLAFALTFQAPDKTLRDDIVAKQVARIVNVLGQQLGAELRA
jgi:phenylalanyl-tRNA synthetase beta chain